MKPFVNEKRRDLLVVAVCIAALSVSSVAAQVTKDVDGRGFEAERLAILPFVNTTDVDQWDALGSTMAHIIELTLRLSGQFDVAELDGIDAIDPYSPGGTVRLGRIAEERRLDAAIIGRISALSNGRIELQTSVFSAETGEITGSETREAFGSFDILVAAEELVAIASSAFLGFKAGFGEIILEPSRPDVAYRVYIDGIDVGTNITSVPQVLTGRRTIEIAEITARGERYLYSADRSIRTGEAIKVEFGLPAVTFAERQEILASHDLAMDLLGRPEQRRVAIEALEQSRRLLTASQSAVLGPLRDTQALLETVWRLDEEMYRLGPEDYVGDEGYEIGQPMIVIASAAAVVSTAPEVEAQDRLIRERISRNGAAHYYLMRLLWVEALTAAEWERSEALLDDMEAVVETYDLPFRNRLRRDRTEWLEVKNDTAVYRRRSRRAERTFLTNWTTERYGRELSLSKRVFSDRYINRTNDATQIDDPDEDGVVEILVLGPPGEVVHLNGQPRVLPFLTEQPIGETFESDRAPIVEADRTRIFVEEFSIIVLE